MRNRRIAKREAYLKERMKKLAKTPTTKAQNKHQLDEIRLKNLKTIENELKRAWYNENQDTILGRNRYK